MPLDGDSVYPPIPPPPPLPHKNIYPLSPDLSGYHSGKFSVTFNQLITNNNELISHYLTLLRQNIRNGKKKFAQIKTKLI